jgi:hypothetical protein
MNGSLQKKDLRLGGMGGRQILSINLFGEL